MTRSAVLVLGIVIGLAFGLTVSALAFDGKFFYGGQELSDKSSPLQLGYIAGVTDTLNELGVREGNGDDLNIGNIARCLDRRAETLGTLVDWAKNQYSFHNESVPAAAYIIRNACARP
jgi:hypothetical protein